MVGIWTNDHSMEKHSTVYGLVMCLGGCDGHCIFDFCIEVFLTQHQSSVKYGGQREKHIANYKLIASTWICSHCNYYLAIKINRLSAIDQYILIFLQKHFYYLQKSKPIFFKFVLGAEVYFTTVQFYYSKNQLKTFFF